MLLLTTRPAHGPTPRNSPGSGFTDFCFRKDIQTHFTDYIGLLDIDADGYSSSSSTAHCCHSRQRGRHCRHCSNYRSATASARPWSSYRKRPQSRLHTLKIFYSECEGMLPSGPITRTIHPSSYPIRKDADGHASTRTTAHCRHSRQRGRHRRHCPKYRSATASARPRSTHRKRPTYSRSSRIRRSYSGKARQASSERMLSRNSIPAAHR